MDMSCLRTPRCQACPAGAQQPSAGASECEPCPLGTAKATDSTDLCDPCASFGHQRQVSSPPIWSRLDHASRRTIWFGSQKKPPKPWVSIHLSFSTTTLRPVSLLSRWARGLDMQSMSWGNYDSALGGEVRLGFAASRVKDLKIERRTGNPMRWCLHLAISPFCDPTMKAHTLYESLDFETWQSATDSVPEDLVVAAKLGPSISLKTLGIGWYCLGYLLAIAC